MAPDHSETGSPTAGGAGPVGDDKSALATRTVQDGEVGSQIVLGPYRLLQLIGAGGMGEVWLAEQKQPVRRRVAIKLIKAGMDTREVVARFESERQALALMDHPGIAKVFDAGSTPQGLPYFVMEYVSGVPITEYCDRHKLTTRQRLELLVRVCEGVQHAHQKAIIHRDLKPSNILVGEVDGKPVPRIIDFGVAKATSQRLTVETMFTQVGAILGTPGYMSPEQADSAGLDVDTRTDVYSLGVVLYELLVGVMPLDFNRVPLDEILRRLRNEDAPPPSTKLRTQGAESVATAQNRGADPPTLARMLKGDLDAITLKALEKDRSRRYATPLELAADIGRYLKNEPVQARRAGAAYRARKYIRRHRAGVTVAAVGLVLLIGFAVAQMFELRRITRERDRADRITAFMTGVFKVSDPSEARGNTVTARELLDKAAGEINRSLASDPELQARMMHTMAGTYSELGLSERALSLIQRAVEIQRRVLGLRAPDTLRSEEFLALILSDVNRNAEAEKLFRPTLDAMREVLGPEDRATLHTYAMLGLILSRRGRYAEAEKVQRAALDIQRRVFGSGDTDTLRTMNNLAATMQDERRFAEAGDLYRETIEIQRRALGPEHPDTLWTMNNLASILELAGSHAEAERLYREVLAARRRILGPDHPETLITLRDLGYILYDENRFRESETLWREIIESRLRTLGPQDPQTFRAQSSLATTLSHEGRQDAAETLLRDAMQRAERAKDRRSLAGLSYDYACVAAIAGHPQVALARLRAALGYGYRDAEQTAADDDLKSLHGNPQFEALVAELRRIAEPARASASAK